MTGWPADAAAPAARSWERLAGTGGSATASTAHDHAGRHPNGPGQRRRDERGSISVLVIGLTGVLLALVAVVVDVSAVILAKRGAASAADGAAAAAAQQLDRAALLRDGLAEGVPLDAAAVARAVADHERTVQATLPGLRLVADVDGTRATVTAVRQVRLPFTGFLRGGSTVEVTAVSTVRSPVVP